MHEMFARLAVSGAQIFQFLKKRIRADCRQFVPPDLSGIVSRHGVFSSEEASDLIQACLAVWAKKGLFLAD
jgi:hypothetical protein